MTCWPSEPGASTGLVAYAGSAHVVIPLARDGRIIEMFADQLEQDIMPRQGNAAAEDLVVADALLRGPRSESRVARRRAAKHS